MGNTQKTFISAIALGTCALFMSMFFTYYVPASAAQLSYVFLFIAANTCSVPGTLLASMVAILPEAFISGDYINAAQMISFFSVVCAFSRRYPKMPSHIFVFLLWMIVILPAAFILQGETAFLSTLMVRATGNMFVCALSEALLLHTTLWNLFTGRTRVVSNHQALSPIFIAVASGAVLLSLAPLLSNNEHGLLSSMSLDHLFMIFVAVTIVPSYISWRLAVYFRDLPEQGILRRNYHQPEKEEESNEAAESELAPRDSGAVQVRHEEGFCTLNAQHQIIHMNKSFRTFAEVRDGDFTNKTLATICMDPDLREQLKILDEQVPSGDQHNSEYGRMRDDKVSRFFRIGINKRSKDRFTTITLKDITDQRRVESHLLQAQKMKSLGSIVRGVAHSFNNALTTIIGNASLVKGSGNSDKYEEALEEIITVATSAGELAWSLLDYAQKKPSLMRDQDLNRLIDSNIPLLRNMIGENYELTYKEDDQPLGVLADGNLLTQLLSNLIINASESYNGKPGKIILSTATEEMDEQIARLHPGARPGTFARIQVQDFGCGMSPDTLARAFDPLFTTKKKEGHSGLGLSIVFAILRAHDGFLTVDSFPEKGTTFSLYIPLRPSDGARSSSEEEVEEELKPSAPESEDRSILVVDDEPGIRSLLERMLSQLGYSVQCCADGEAALKLYETSTFDLIVTDQTMPSMSGSDLAEEIRKKDATAKILVMTGAAPDEQSPEKSLLLTKPFDIETLSTQIQRALS